MMFSLTLMGITTIIYSTFFNTFLSGEYLLFLLYMILSLLVPCMTQAAIAYFTRIGNSTMNFSALLLISSLVVIACMGLSVAIGGTDMYRLWIARGAMGYAGIFYASSWRYNVIVFVHYYLYWIVLMIEVIYVLCYLIRNLRNFQHNINEYYSSQQRSIRNIRGIYVTVGINCIVVFINYFFFPFNHARPLWVARTLCVIQTISIYLLGKYIYMLDFAAERIDEKIRNNKYGRGNLRKLGHQIALYVDDGQACLNPDLSVFLLSDHFKVSQDDIVDAVHMLHGTSFSEYVDNLRIEHATALLQEQPNFDYNDSEQVTQLAHACGYLHEKDFQRAFAKVLQTTLQEWDKRR